MTDRSSRFSVALALAVCPSFSSLAFSEEIQCLPELVLYGNQVAASYARAVAGVGDVDGDGADDLIVGIAGYDSAVGDDAGKVIIYSGATGTLIRAWLGETTESLFGHAVEGIGDVNGDDWPDVVVGAPIYDAASQIGKIYVFSGATGQLLWSKLGAGPEDQFGWSVAAAGDVDGDQIPDVIAGARSPGPLIEQPGKAYVYSGADGRLIWEWEGEEESDWFGASVAGAGDIDNDGFADLIVGAPKAGGQAPLLAWATWPPHALGTAKRACLHSWAIAIGFSEPRSWTFLFCS